MIAKIWSRDTRQTVKSCAGILIIGTAVAVAMVIVRLVGERRLQGLLNKLISLKRGADAEKLAADSFASDNRA